MPTTIDISTHDPECMCIHCTGEYEYMCPDHLEERCEYCYDLYGRVTCHHPDHEDFHPEDDRY